MITVKICGITSLQDGILAVQAGADLLGFNFYPPSPRFLPAQRAAKIIGLLKAKLGQQAPLMVGIFVNETTQHILDIMDTADLDYAQLSGDEPPAALTALNGVAFKGLRPPDVATLTKQAALYAPLGPSEPTAPGLLLDAYHPKLYGGSGQRADWQAAAELAGSVRNMLLAGGLTPANVAEAVQQVRPWGIDVASGVESQPGVQDSDAVQAFISAAREAARNLEKESP